MAIDISRERPVRDVLHQVPNQSEAERTVAVGDSGRPDLWRQRRTEVVAQRTDIVGIEGTAADVGLTESRRVGEKSGQRDVPPAQLGHVNTIQIAVDVLTQPYPARVGEDESADRREYGGDRAQLEDRMSCTNRRPLRQRSEERRVGKECRSRWSPYH